MANRNAWQYFIDSALFEHLRYERDSNWSVEEIDSGLGLIHDHLYIKNIALSGNDLAAIIPHDHTKQENIGYNSIKVKRQLESIMSSQAAIGGKRVSTYKEDENFREYVNELLTILSQKAQTSLPTAIPSRTTREEGSSRDHSEAAQAAASQAEDASKNLTKAKEAAEAAKQAAENVIPNMLTVLGVFISIVIAVVAAYLSIILIDIQKESEPLSAALCFLMGHILLNVIFLLLYLISKLTHRTLACNCPVGNRMNCSGCSFEHCHWGNKVWLRYPYVVILNAGFVFAYFLLLVWPFAKSHIISHIAEKASGTFYWSCLAVISVIVVFLLVVWCLWLVVRRPKADKKPRSQKRSKQKEKFARVKKLEQQIELLRSQLDASKTEIDKVKEEITTLKKTAAQGGTQKQTQQQKKKARR